MTQKIAIWAPSHNFVGLCFSSVFMVVLYCRMMNNGFQRIAARILLSIISVKSRAPVSYTLSVELGAVRGADVQR